MFYVTHHTKQILVFLSAYMRNPLKAHYGHGKLTIKKNQSIPVSKSLQMNK